MHTEAGNGFEAWRQLVRRDMPSAGSARVVQRSALVKSNFESRLDSYEEQLQQFEGAVRRYGQTFGEELPDSIHQTLLESNTPPELRTQIEMQAFVTAGELREAISAFVAIRMTSSSAGASSSAQGPTPMDIGALDNGARSGGKRGANGKGGRRKGRQGRQGREGEGRLQAVEGQAERESTSVRWLVQPLRQVRPQEVRVLVSREDRQRDDRRPDAEGECRRVRRRD